MCLSEKQYAEYATYTREYDEYNDNPEPYGLHFWDGDQIVDTFWFATEDEREVMVDEFNSVNPAEVICKRK